MRRVIHEPYVHEVEQGQDAAALAYEAKIEAATRAVVRRAMRARKSSLDFFDFAWREEIMHKRVKATAHQRIAFAFIDAHPMCVVRMPPGFAKTTGSVATGLYFLGREPTSRGGFISAAEAQAYKPVGQMRDAIEFMDESYPEMRVCFPNLKRSHRANDPWSTRSFTVERHAGIRDASVTAFGLDSVKIVGSRLSWIVVDDILSLMNTFTKEARDHMARWFMQIVRDRLDPRDGRCVVTNVPHDKDDLTYHLELKEKWPTLTMDAFGGIQISNTDWDTDEIRPSKQSGYMRLTAHDSAMFGAPLMVRNPRKAWQWAEAGTDDAKQWEAQGGERRHIDFAEEIPLWPMKFSLAFLKEREGSSEMSRSTFATNFKMKPASAGDQRCDPQWIENCKKLAQQVGHTHQLNDWTPKSGSFVVMGVDVGGLGLSTDSDWSCFFIYECLTEQHHVSSGLILPAGTRRILRIKYGRWKPRDFVNEFVRLALAFNASARIEKNSESALQQWIEEESARVMVTGHTTGMNKHHLIYGVESVFMAMDKQRWLIPNVDGVCEPDVERWCQENLDYRPPPAHTPDGLMAAWIAQEEERSNWSLMATS